MVHEPYERRMTENMGKSVLKTVRDDKNSNILIKHNSTMATDKKFPSQGKTPMPPLK